MARQKFAPTHDVCAKMRFVPSSDSAWKHALVDRETGEIAKAAVAELGENPSAVKLAEAQASPYDSETGHVYWRYFAGATRFDLSDPALAPYIDLEAKPELWRFRRLTLDERERVAYYDRQGKRETGMAYCYCAAVVALENPGSEQGEALADYIAKLPKTGRTAEQLAELKTLTDDYATSIPTEVGVAAFQASQDLTRPEAFR